MLRVQSGPAVIVTMLTMLTLSQEQSMVRIVTIDVLCSEIVKVALLVCLRNNDYGIVFSKLSVCL